MERLKSAFMMSQARTKMLDQLLSGYRMCLAELENSAAAIETGLKQDTIARVKQVLLDKEKNEDEKLQEEFKSNPSFD
jgi:hypothetical protein